MKMVSLTIDGTRVEVTEGVTILEAARKAGIYIPSLCYHPDLPPAPGLKSTDLIFYGKSAITAPQREYNGCEMCVVEVEGELVKACTTTVKEGMIVSTDSAKVRQHRIQSLARILSEHPHACIFCKEKEGCDRIACSLNVPVTERCCEKLGNCEIEKLVEYLEFKEQLPKYQFKNLPIIEDEPLFIRNYNLCIGCLRCVRACNYLAGVGATNFIIEEDGKVKVGTVGPSLKESNCRFCGFCVEVCPTGALLDKEGPVEREALIACKYTCPVGMNAHEYIRLISEGKFEEALHVIQEVPFSSILGYVCHHPCEDKCRRGKVNEPIAICALKRFLAEYGVGSFEMQTKPKTGKKVAIIGAGPAGLSSAYYLSALGHDVTVFESMSEPGGMLRYGIPKYRLPRQVLDKEIAKLKKMGVRIITNAHVPKEIKLDDLKREYDAIVLAIGAWKSRRLNVEGSELKGVMYALDFLKAVNSGERVDIGNKVVVVGGGNVAIDAAMTALRLKAKEVELVCLESLNEMPAFKWCVQEALEEGIKINPNWGVKRILSNGDEVSGIELVKCTSVFDEQGRFNPSFDESITKVISCNTVILAIGQKIDHDVIKQIGIELNEKGFVKVTSDMKTNIEGVFAAGDVVNGPTSVVEAIASGKKVAEVVDKYLGGGGKLELIQAKPEKLELRLEKIERFADKGRVKIPRLPVEQRTKCFDIIEMPLSKELAIEEAKRCLRCNLRLHISPPIFPPIKLMEFCERNIVTVPESEGVYILYDESKNVIYIKGAPNLRRDLMSQLNTIKEAKFFKYELEPMYSSRESELLQAFIRKHGTMPKYNLGIEEELY